MQSKSAIEESKTGAQTHQTDIKSTCQTQVHQIIVPPRDLKAKQGPRNTS